ncbi:MAG: ABC transporter ATP-binding protein [Bacteroidota bacterium]
MSNTIIKVENLSKQYRLGQVGTGTIRDDLGRFWAKVLGKEDPTMKIGATNTLTSQQLNEKQSNYVWALKDINFSVEQGEVLGIIGKNGAGKSTLLKILSKVTTPTTGNIKVKGRIASLLEVGTGFHPELSGRENIFLNGAILGMTKAEIRSKFDEIVDFAGVERYIDTPVKRYSSGMYVRLAFAVAAHLEPEILIVDEVLAVGDAEFQKKALGKMQNISKEQGRTVLFVSHNMTSIEALCNSSIVLKNGSIEYEGIVEKAIEHYINSCSNRRDYQTIIEGISFCHKDITIEDIRINGSNSSTFEIDNDNRIINFYLSGILTTKRRMALEAGIFDHKENILAYYSPGHIYGEIKYYGPGRFEIIESFVLPENITKGEFYFGFSVSHPTVEIYIGSNNKINIISKGMKTATGLEINYNNKGFIVMNRAVLANKY